MTAHDLDQERDDWTEFVNTAGWQRFLDHATAQYGSLTSAREALQRLQNKDFEGAQATARAYELVGQLIAWPTTRLKALTSRDRTAQTTTQGR